MQIIFWGTRGSTPAPLTAATIEEKIRQALQRAVGLKLDQPGAIDRFIERLPFLMRGTIGGNTACVEVRSGERTLILDAGSGLRPLGNELLRRNNDQAPTQINILISHTHWDHIQGFPFFAPAFQRSCQITFYSPIVDLHERLLKQQQSTYFPIPMERMPATITCETIPIGEWVEIGGLQVCAIEQAHPGISYGYRVADEQHSMVFASDAEYKQLDRAGTETVIDFFRDTDLLVFDAQYSLSEALDRPDWGHSSALVGAEFARRAHVRRLALFHHDPTSSDAKIWRAKEQAESYLNHEPGSERACEVLVAYDGLEITL